MRSIARYIWLNAVRKGFFGGQQTWMTVFVVIGATKVLRRVSGSTQEVVYSEELRPGQALVITHHEDVRLGDKQR